jgi:release factor glutamine methyltransferase
MNWTIKSLLDITCGYLKEKGINSARLSAEILLAHQLETDRMRLYLDMDRPLKAREVAGYRELIKRRIRHEPVSYITGSKEFWSMDFIVGPEVLIPRPESELLIETALSLYMGSRLPKRNPLHIMDMGTGSGALSVCLACEIQEAAIWGGDISAGALEIARENARMHGVEHRIQFLLGDLFQPFEGREASFDLLLSNPPYVGKDEFETLPSEVRDYEPRIALDGHEEGLFFIKKILIQGRHFISPGGWILMEMAPEQTEKALELIERMETYGQSQRIKDYSQQYRVVMAQKRG